MKVLISTSSFGKIDPRPLEVLKGSGVEVVMTGLGRTLKAEEVEEWSSGCIGIIAGTEPLAGDTLKKITGLKVISRLGAGLDNVDMESAEKLGIQVYNTPDGPTKAVAELTIALMLDVLRGVSRADANIRAGKWEKRMGNLLDGKIVGIIGLGRIGRSVALLAGAFNCAVIGCDTCPDEDWSDKENIELCSKNDLLSRADIVSLHVPCNDTDMPLLGKDEIDSMRRGSYLINASRGKLVDEDALLAALKRGHLAGAALDTFTSEPYTGPLRELDNVVLSPHVGSYAIESRVQMELQAVENMLKGLELA